MSCQLVYKCQAKKEKLAATYAVIVHEFSNLELLQIAGSYFRSIFLH